MGQIPRKATLDASLDATMLGSFAVISPVLVGVADVDDGLKPAFAGLVFGLAGNVAAVRLVRSMLYEARPLGPAVFLLDSVVLVVVAGVACMVPAWRASRLDPI